MAKHLDLEEQEQLEELKHYWKTYGDLITWALIVVFGAIAAWNGYQYWQRSQAFQAAAMFDEVDRSAASGDIARLERSLGDMKDKYGRTTYAHQAALLAARVFFEKGNPDAAKAALSWVAEHSSDEGYSAVARLRLASVMVNQKSFDDALRQLEGSFPKDFEALVADRRADILVLQGKNPEAISEYQKAYKLFGTQSEYRRLVEVKLNALGIDPLNSDVGASGAVTGTVQGEK